jgi:hypothetical protein
MRGQYVEPITDDLKEKFLDLIASGYTRPEAASALDASSRQFRSLCNPQSHRYDEDFHRQYQKLTEKGGEHQGALVERLQTAAVERGLRSSDRLLEKLLVLYHPDWEIHRPQAMQLNFKVDEMKVLFAGLSDDTLQQMVSELEQKQGELGSGLPVIDVDPS